MGSQKSSLFLRCELAGEKMGSSDILGIFFLVVSSSCVIQMSGGAFLPLESFKNISMNFSIPCPVDVQIKMSGNFGGKVGAPVVKVTSVSRLLLPLKLSLCHTTLMRHEDRFLPCFLLWPDYKPPRWPGLCVQLYSGRTVRQSKVIKKWFQSLFLSFTSNWRVSDHISRFSQTLFCVLLVLIHMSVGSCTVHLQTSPTSSDVFPLPFGPYSPYFFISDHSSN